MGLEKRLSFDLLLDFFFRQLVQITVAGYSTVSQAENIHDLLGYMPQKFGLYEDLTVIQNLMLYAELRGVDLETKQEKINYLLKFTNLQLFKERLAGNLSGG